MHTPQLSTPQPLLTGLCYNSQPQDHATSERMQRSALKAVQGGKGRPEIVAQVRSSRIPIEILLFQDWGLPCFPNQPRASLPCAKSACQLKIAKHHPGRVFPGRHALRAAEV